MNTKSAALMAAFVLASGCGSMNGPTSPPATSEDESSPVASDTATGSSSGGTQQSSPARPTGRTREEVRAEAIEAMKNHKPTVEQERDWFNPYAPGSDSRY